MHPWAGGIGAQLLSWADSHTRKTRQPGAQILNTALPTCRQTSSTAARLSSEAGRVPKMSRPVGGVEQGRATSQQCWRVMAVQAWHTWLNGVGFS